MYEVHMYVCTCVDLSEDDRAGRFDSVREESEDEIVDEDTVVGVDNGNEEDHEDEEELDRRNLEIEVGELQLQVAKLEETNDDLQCYLKDQVHELQQKLESAQVAIYSEHKSLHVLLEHLQSQLGRAVSLSGANIVKNDDTKTYTELILLVTKILL